MALMDTLRKLRGEIDLELEKAEMDAAERNSLKDSDFALPGRKYPINDEAHARNALARVSQFGTPEEKAKVRAAVKRRYPDIDVSKAESEWAVEVDLLKGDTDERTVYGVVLNPEVRDSQGDIISPAEIRKTAHKFMTDYRQHDVQHSDVVKTQDGRPIAEPVESFLVPTDMNFNGTTVRKGAWILGLKVNDEQAWQDIKKGELTGFSIFGTGTRTPD